MLRDPYKLFSEEIVACYNQRMYFIHQHFDSSYYLRACLYRVKI